MNENSGEWNQSTFLLTKERNAKQVWRGFSVVVIAVILWRTFHTVEWRPNFDDNSVVCFGHSWWGLKEQVVRCEWRHDDDPDRDPPEGWCTRYSDGKWHIFFAEEGDDLVLNWPTSAH